MYALEMEAGESVEEEWAQMGGDSHHLDSKTRISSLSPSHTTPSFIKPQRIAQILPICTGGSEVEGRDLSKYFASWEL